MSNETETESKPLSDRQKAFKRYKEGVRTSGKPFFPFGVYHDLIAACGVILIIIMLSVVWYAQANCDSWVNVSCNRAATPLEQDQFTPDHPGATVWEKGGKEIIVKNGDEIPAGATPSEDVKKPLLGALYEDQADPATTQYHPRPEWYFYFLFYLLIVFKHPNLLILGTIGLPTIWLIILILWPFLDRKRERRPSRRPIAMTAMVFTAIALLSFTYLGSKTGKEGGGDFSADQKAMPGYELIIKGEKGASCKGCHVIGGSTGNQGPVLDDIGTKNLGIAYQIKHLANPASTVPGSGMPPQRATFTDEELAQVAAFLETLGVPDRATQAEYKDADASTAEDALK